MKKQNLHEGSSSEMLDGKVPMHKDIKRLLMIDSTYAFFYGLAQPFIVIFFNNFGSLEEVGISVALLLIIQGIVSLITSKFISKLGSKRILLISQALEGIRIVLFLFVTNVYQVYFLQIVGGIFKGFNIPAYNNLYVNVCRDESSTSIGTMSSTTNIAYGVSALIGGLIIGEFGYMPAFILWAAQEVVYGVYVYFKV